MSDIETKTNAENIIKNLATYSYSQIFDIAPAERDLLGMHIQYPNLVEPLIGLLFCSVMFGKKQQAKEYALKIWNLGASLNDSLEMLYSDMLINIGEFEKAATLISARMDDMENNLNLFYMTVIKYALYTGELYILNNLANYPEVYITDTNLFYFAQRHFEGMPNTLYKGVLQIIYDTLGDLLCTTEYMKYADGGIQFCLYTSADVIENNKLHKILTDKINAYYTSMHEKVNQEIHFTIENISLHPAWW